jgi:MoxR-like ATPase
MRFAIGNVADLSGRGCPEGSRPPLRHRPSLPARPVPAHHVAGTCASGHGVADCLERRTGLGARSWEGVIEGAGNRVGLILHLDLHSRPVTDVDRRPGVQAVAEGLAGDSARLRAVAARARRGLVERELLVEAVILCAVAGEHLLVVGPPGTAKSQAARRVASGLGGRYFEYLLGRFTEPNEVFGPVDLRRLRDGVVEIETAGMLPEADVAFLDEVFLGSTAILNTLLSILNERTFRRGSTAVACPLRVCVGATNVLPEDPALAAFADRFLARVFVEPVADARLEEMFEVGWAGDTEADRLVEQFAPAGDGAGRSGTGDGAGGRSVGGLLGAVDRLSAAARGCDVRPVQPVLAAAVRRLRAAGVQLSDRRAVRAQRLVAAAAALDGRTSATAADLWVLPLVAPTSDAQAGAQEVLADLMEQARSSTLPYAAEELSRGVRARAERLTGAGSALLAGLAGSAAEGDERLRVEATLREIDACFAEEDLPEALAEVRGRLVAAVRG